MTRDEALGVAVEALGYVLDNDYEYLSDETNATYQEAWNTLQGEEVEAT